MRKIISFFLTAIFAFFLSQSAFADSAGFADEKERSIIAKTPFDKSSVSILWHTSEGSDVGIPLSDGEFVYVSTGNKINKLSEKDGKLVCSAELGEKVSKNCRGALLSGILVQPTRSGICVIDTNEMKIIREKKFGEIITDVGIFDEKIYFGEKTSDGFSFITAEKNSLDVIAEYKSQSAFTSPATFGGYVIFGSGSKLVCAKNNDFVENELGAEITHIFSGEYAIFMCGADGALYKIWLTSEGKLEDEQPVSCKIGGVLTPLAECDNKLFVGSTEGFFAVDGLNMEIVKKFPQMKNAAAPVITLGNGLRAYTAAAVESDGGKWYLYNFYEANGEISVSEVAKIVDFNNGAITVSTSGIMFFRDNLGQVWAAAQSEINVFIIVLKIVITIAIIVLLVLTVRAWVKKHSSKKNDLNI